MKIGILGSGHIGAAVGSQWTRAGHDVMFSALDLDALAPLVESLGARASLGSPADAAAFGEVVLIALPASAVVEVLSASGPLEGKILIHAANGFGANAVTLAALSDRFPGARCIRAYNTLQAHVLENDGGHEPPYALLLSGDDEEAKHTVSELITQIGFAPVDIGGTADAVLQDPGSPLWNNRLSEAQARIAVEELRTTGHTGADPIAIAVKALASRGSDDGAWWLEEVTRAVFRAGMSWRVVQAKWPGFRTDFHGFDPDAVAAMDGEELAQVESDPNVIRNVRKLQATVANGRAMQELLAEHGGFRAYLSSFAEPTDAADDLAGRFKFLGRSGASRLLLSASRSLTS
jgi:predicted dinucleotide-binding enzyme/3-methyladenine DNA glycosylase Tag